MISSIKGFTPYFKGQCTIKDPDKIVRLAYEKLPDKETRQLFLFELKGIKNAVEAIDSKNTSTIEVKNECLSNAAINGGTENSNAKKETDCTHSLTVCYNYTTYPFDKKKMNLPHFPTTAKIVYEYNIGDSTISAPKENLLEQITNNISQVKRAAIAIENATVSSLLNSVIKALKYNNIPLKPVNAEQQKQDEIDELMKILEG